MKRIVKYLPIIFLLAISCLYLYKRVDDKSALTIGDYLVDFYKGEIPYTMTNSEKPFKLPAIWTFYIMYFVLLISWKISSFFAKEEHQKMIRFQSRKRLHQHHILCIFKETFCIWLLTYIVFILFAICMNARFHLPNATLQMRYSNIDISRLNTWELGIHLVILPFVILASIAILQYVITLFTSTIISIVIITALLVISVFYFHPLLFGNYLMLIRHESLMCNGAQWEIGICISLIVTISSIQLSYFHLRKRDLF